MGEKEAVPCVNLRGCKSLIDALNEMQYSQQTDRTCVVVKGPFFDMCSEALINSA